MEEVLIIVFYKFSENLTEKMCYLSNNSQPDVIATSV